MFKRHRSRIASLLAGLAILALSLAPSSANAQAKQIKIGMSVPDVALLMLYVADAKGMFKAEGIDVQLVQFNSDASSAQALTAGAVQINGGSITSVLESYSSGRDLTTFWSCSNLPGYIWYGQPKYNSIKDLKGHGKIGISSIASLTHRISAWAVSAAGLDPVKDIQYVAAGGPLERVAALKAGQVDAIPATAPGMFILEKDGYKPLLKLADVMPEFVYETYYARKGFVEREPETIKAVIRAVTKAKYWSEQNREEATDILIKNLGGEASQTDIYRKTVDWALPYFPANGKFAEKSVDVMLEFYREQGKIKEIPKHSAFTDYSYIEFFEKNPIK